MSKEIVHCTTCGKPKHLYPSQIRQYKNHFCGNECRGKWQAGRVTAARNPKWSGGKKDVSCGFCGDLTQKYEYPSADYKRRFCSNECYVNWQKGNRKGKSNSNYRGGEWRSCGQCGKRVWVKPSRKEKKTQFCSKGCVALWLSNNTTGEAAANWQGGISFAPYPAEWRKSLKVAIRERDSNKCQVCGMPQEQGDRKLDVHHIDYDKDNLDGNNLISLCRKCHIKTNFDREHWQKYFSHNKASLAASSE